MESPSIGGDNDHLDVLCHQIKAPMGRMGYILLSCWSKESQGISHTSQAIIRAIGCFPQPNGKAVSLKTQLIYVTKH